jgi:hypothetical protein
MGGASRCRVLADHVIIPGSSWFSLPPPEVQVKGGLEVCPATAATGSLRTTSAGAHGRWGVQGRGVPVQIHYSSICNTVSRHRLFHTAPPPPPPHRVQAMPEYIERGVRFRGADQYWQPHSNLRLCGALPRWSISALSVFQHAGMTIPHLVFTLLICIFAGGCLDRFGERGKGLEGAELSRCAQPQPLQGPCGPQ